MFLVKSSFRSGPSPLFPQLTVFGEGHGNQSLKMKVFVGEQVNNSATVGVSWVAHQVAPRVESKQAAEVIL